MLRKPHKGEITNALLASRRVRRLHPLLFSLLLIAAPGQAWAQPVGPLQTSEQNPLYRMLYVPDAEAADLVGEGLLRIDLSTSYSSMFEADDHPRHSHLFDLEQMTNSLTLRYGLSPSVEVGARIGLYTDWRGFLDRPISGFHDFFGFPNAGREQRPNNEYLFLFAHDALAAGQIGPEAEGRAFSLETVGLNAKWRFYGEGVDSNALSLSGAIQRTGGPLDEGRLGGAVLLHGRASTESHFHFHGSAGLTFAHAPVPLRSITRDHAVFFSTAAEYRLRPRFSLIAQINGSSNYFKGFDGGEFDKIPLNLVLGLGATTERGWRWQLSFAEDLIPSGPAVDFTADFELSKTVFGG